VDESLGGVEGEGKNLQRCTLQPQFCNAALAQRSSTAQQHARLRAGSPKIFALPRSLSTNHNLVHLPAIRLTFSRTMPLAWDEPPVGEVL
jgi:hypothetical protein